jgi:hypothetical protein
MVMRFPVIGSRMVMGGPPVQSSANAMLAVSIKFY